MRRILVSLFVVLTWTMISATPGLADGGDETPDVTPDSDPWDPHGTMEPRQDSREDTSGDSSGWLASAALSLWSIPWVAR